MVILAPINGFTDKDAFKFAFVSGGAEGGVALFGALAGAHIISKFSAIDHWIAFGLLAGVARKPILPFIASISACGPNTKGPFR